MENEPDKSPEPIKKKRIWPWVLLQFLPTVVIAILVLTFRRVPWLSPPKILCLGILFYGYILSFLFYRSRGKSIFMSLLISLGTSIVVLVANAILIAAIVFVGCAIAMGKGGRIAP